MDALPEPFLFSESFDKLIEALATAEQAFAPVVKDRANPHFGFKYATLDAMQTATRPFLAANGLVITQLLWPTAQTIKLYTRLVHVSGQWMQSSVPLSAWGKGPQVFGSELTYLKRYCYAAMLNISADQDDDDANAAQGSGDTRAADRPPPRPPLSGQTNRQTIGQWLDNLRGALRAAPDVDAMSAILARDDLRNAERDFTGDALGELQAMVGEARATILAKVRAPRPPAMPPKPETPAFKAQIIDAYGEIAGAPITDPVLFAKTLVIGIEGFTSEERAALIEHNEAAIDEARQLSSQAGEILKDLDEPVSQTSGQTIQAIVPPVERGKVSWPAYVAALKADLGLQAATGLLDWLTAQRDGLMACPIGQRVLAIQAVVARFDKVGATPPVWLAEMMRPTTPNGEDERWVGNIISAVSAIHEGKDFTALVKSPEVQASMKRLQSSNPAQFDRANDAFLEKSRLLDGQRA
jgi:hypothetical protein